MSGDAHLNPTNLKGKSTVHYWSWLCFVAVCCLFSACKVGPDYHRPAALGTNSFPSSYSTLADTNAPEWKAAMPAAHLPHGTWWQLFGDPELNRLETLAAVNSPQLAAALARYDQARAQINVSRADLFPQADAVPSYNRQRTSFNEPDSGHAAGIAHTFNTFTFPLQAGWEVDLWGRVRRQVESARATATASADDLESTRLALPSAATSS